MRHLLADQFFWPDCRLGRGVACVTWDRWLPLHRQHPAVSSAGQSFNVTGFLGRVAQRLPQPVHGSADTVLELHNRVVRPEPLAQLFPSYNLQRTFEQENKYSKGLLRQADSFASILAQLTRAKVQFEAFEADNRLGRSDFRHDTPRSARDSTTSSHTSRRRFVIHYGIHPPR